MALSSCQHGQEAMAESLERMLPVRKVGSSSPGRVKPMTYQIGTCQYLAWYPALLGYGKNWLSQYQVNVTK